VTFPTRHRLISNHFETTKEVPLTCESMVIRQSRNGDKEGSYLNVICGEMITQKCTSVRRRSPSGGRQEQFAGQENAACVHEHFCFGVVTKSEQEGQVETKGFAEYAL
jgi:hypothetical protein